MIELSTQAAVMAGAALAMLVSGGAAMLYVGLVARAKAARAGNTLHRLEAMVSASPALAMVVRGDGRLEMSAPLADWLGLAPTGRLVGDIAEVATPDVATAFADAIAAAQKAGRAFRMPVRIKDSGRVLMAVGQRAPLALLAPGGVLVWFLDVTEVQGEVEQRTGEVAALRTAYDAVSGLIEAAPMPMWYRGPDLKIAMVNTAYVAAVEAADNADAVARQIELVEGEGLGGPLANAVIARDTRVPQQRAMPATIGGARRMQVVHDVPLPGGGTAGYAIDIEDLEQTRGGLKRFGDAQRAMLDRLSAGVAQFDADHGLSFCNQPFRRMFAMRPEWLADRPEFDRVLERMREAKRLPEVRDFPGWKAERRGWFLAAEGAVEEQWHLPAGTHLRVVAQPLPDGGLLTIFEDRTEQVQLASARDTLLRVRTATFDNLFEALGVFAADGRLQLWNNRLRQVWGFDDALLNAHPRVDAFAKAAAPQLADPTRAKAIADLIRSATVDRQQRGGHVTFKDGRAFEFAAVPLPDGNALFTMIDVTASQRIKRALEDRNQALEAADRVKTAFVANMSYELRTPLTSIKGFGEMLHGGMAGPLSESATEYVAAILESSARLGTLIDDVLDLTGAEATAGERVAVDLDMIAQAAAAAIAPLATAKRQALVVEIAGGAGHVTGDPRRLREVVEHLLRHAVSGTPEKGRVLLHVDGDATAAQIVVSDDGPGMDARAVARAFDRFAQGGIARDGERALGLGLPLAKQFVEAQGGTVTLLSEPGEGTLVTVVLPRG